ncbi:benzoate/H(+) symporter BenE family transporter [Paeniglutamicibacter sp. ABSL32-1]|uniref:benzoate/H(+) symporter BenE family transporter n=1 Tax=Paeniglutamicibacter quisquiliarum TaxID=2849498 RepID=UPI001C2D86B2|nr:benzoate/H(+) symporter BenE family transporter [Paeniglutamicibacter quisquiliarum]
MSNQAGAGGRGPRTRLPGVLGDVSVSAVCAGFIAVAVSYAGPMLVILQAAERAGLDPARTASWVWAVSVGSGIVGLLLSLFTRQPVVVAWSVPGAALLLTVLGDYGFSEAIGAYIVAGLLGLVLSLSGLFGKLLAAVPRPILAAVLAGVLLPFVLNVTQAVLVSPVVAGGLVVAYFVGRRLFPKYAVPAALVAGVLLSVIAGQAQSPDLSLALTVPVFTVPTFSIQAIMGISVPLLIVTMAGQNGPGLVMMRTSGYEPNDRLLLSGTCVASVLFAPFGSHAINLAAITAGICCGREAHEDPAKRYIAGAAGGVFFIGFGLFSATILDLFAAVPGELITAMAGVALLGALQGSLLDMLDAGRHGPSAIEAAVVTLIVTASGIAPLGIVSPFWGVLAGAAVYLLLTVARGRRRARPAAGRSLPAVIPAGEARK